VFGDKLISSPPSNYIQTNFFYAGMEDYHLGEDPSALERLIEAIRRQAADEVGATGVG
jgi:hypothetical protein